MMKRAILMMCAVLACASCFTPAHADEGNVADPPSDMASISVVMNGIGAMIPLRSDNIDVLCERVGGAADRLGTETSSLFFEVCIGLSVEHTDFVINFSALVARAVALEMDPSGKRWSKEDKDAIIAGFRGLLAHQVRLGSASDRLERVLRHRSGTSGMQQADESAAAIAYLHREASIARFVMSAQAALRAMETNSPASEPPARLEPKSRPVAPPARSVPRRGGVPV